MTKILIGSFPSGFDATTIPEGHIEALQASANAKLDEEHRRRQALVADAERTQRMRAAMRFRRIRRALKLCLRVAR